MDSYLSIINGVLNTEVKFLKIFLDGLEDHEKFDAKANEGGELVQHISSLLTKSTTRSLGLRLLLKFIDHCSNDIFEKKGSLWTTLTLKAFNKQELQYQAPIIFEALSKIVERSAFSPDLAKSFASTHISKIYDSLINVSSSHVKYTLRCIETCLRAYPGSSSSSRCIIERFLWKNLDNIDCDVIDNCGKCLHLLQQIKGGNVHGINHKTQWKNYQLKLLSEIHSLFNIMFTNCKEMYEDNVDQKKLPWDSQTFQFDLNPVKKSAQLYTRCYSLIKYLAIALREPFPVEKPIMIKKILNVVIRGLSVNCLMLEQNPVADNIALSILLPMLHVHLLELLNLAILILRGHLRPYSEIILGFIVDGLKWTSAHGDRKHLILRKKLYETVSLWSKIFQGGSCCETIAEYMFQEILSDVTPKQSELTLKVLRGANKHMSKKIRRQIQNSQNDKSHMNQPYSSDRNRKGYISEKKHQELCISALRYLQEVILSVGNFIKPTILKMMQTRIIQICAALYELPPNSTHLYSNRNCRIEIYNVLYAILMSPHYLCPPPTEIVLTIIQAAYSRDDSLKVRIRCGFILKNLEKIIHPQKESLLFNIEARDIRNAFIKMGQENLLNEFECNSFQTPLHNNKKMQESNDLEQFDDNFSEDVRKQPSNDYTSVADMRDQESAKGNINDESLFTTITNSTTNNVNYIHQTAEPIKAQINDNRELSSVEITIISNAELINNIPKSSDFVLHVNEGENIAIVDENERDTDPNVDEPIQKKQKLDNEYGIANKLKMGEKEIVSHIINIDDEDNLLDDIVSQFVDELN